MQTADDLLAGVGDWLVMKPRHAWQTRRVGEVLEILGDPGGELYRVRWEDGSITLVCRDAGFLVQRTREETEEPVLIHEP